MFFHHFKLLLVIGYFGTHGYDTLYGKEGRDVSESMRIVSLLLRLNCSCN
jgi:hypothetical protein